MARIVYFENPLSNESKELNCVSVRQAMIRLNIEKIPLCVTLNGETPDDYDIHSVLKPDDIVEIRRLVHGNSSDAKSSLATLVQIVALVASTFLTGGAAIAVLIGGQLIAGALMKRAAELAAQGGSSEEEQDISANNFSLATARNEAKPLSVMPLPMGSHRMAPDTIANPFIQPTAFDYTFGNQTPIAESNPPGLLTIYGGSPGTNWGNMPANFFGGNFPRFGVKVAPWNFRAFDDPAPGAAPPGVTKWAQLIRDYYNANGSISMQYPAGAVFRPVVVYHNDPSDPLYQRYNLFHFLYREWEFNGATTTNYGTLLTALMSGTEPTYGLRWTSDNPAISNKNAILVSGTSYYPSTVGAGDSAATTISKIGTFLLNTLNNGSYSGNKTTSFSTPWYTKVFGLTSVIKEAILESAQAFSFGIGDLDISNRLVSSIEPVNAITKQAAYTPVIKVDPFKWQLNIVNFGDFPVDHFVCETKRLTNDDFTENPINIDDQGTYNWVYYSGQPGQVYFQFTIKGRCYTTASGSMAANQTYVEIQWRYKGDELWQNSVLYNSNPVDGFIGIQNNNAKQFDIPFEIFGDYTRDEDILEVRVRKRYKETTDNELGDVTELYVDNPIFYTPQPQASLNNRFLDFMPQNIEGLYITSLINDKAATDKYSALVEAKCWVYDFDTETWSWAHSRNPAFWFLYFAYGGFLNPQEGTLTYPYSPTYGWVNYPGHVDSTEKIFGVGLTNDEIDLAKILQWAEWCIDRDLKIDMIMKDDISCAEALDKIAFCGRASSTYYNGKLSVLYEDPEQVPTCMFGMANIIAGSFTVDYAVSDLTRKVVGKYIDRTDWESKTVEAIVPFSDPDNLKVVEITLDGITDTDRAQREVNIMAARQYYQRRSYSWKVDHEGLIAMRGDLVYLSHDSTQYGFSGRIMRFNINAGVVTSIKTGSNLDTSINYVTIRTPDGAMEIYECHVDGQNIVFDETYPLDKAAYFSSETSDNVASDYLNSIPEDFVFIAGSKATPGKLVRISEIVAEDGMQFTIRAVDEDPAMWAYEYETPDVDPESFDDSEVVLEVDNVGYKLLGEGLVKIYWNMATGDFVQIINKATNSPIEANGSYSFTGGEVILELIPGQKYTLEIEPLIIGISFKQISKEVSFWST